MQAAPVMPIKAPGPTLMRADVPWQLWFRSAVAAHSLLVDFAVGSRVDELTDTELEELLDESKR